MKKRIGIVIGCVLLFATQAVFAQKSEVQTSGILYEQGKMFGGDTPIIYINTQRLSADTTEKTVVCYWLEMDISLQ